MSTEKSKKKTKRATLGQLIGLLLQKVFIYYIPPACTVNVVRGESNHHA